MAGRNKRYPGALGKPVPNTERRQNAKILDFRKGRIIARALELCSGDRPAAVLRGIEPKIEEILGIYQRAKDFEADLPTASSVRKKVANVAGKARQLADALDQSEYARDVIARELSGTDMIDAAVKELRQLQSLSKELKRLASAAASAKNRRLTQGSRADKALAWALLELSDIFGQVTGRDPRSCLTWDGRNQKFGGGLFVFVRPFFPSHHSELALGKSLERALVADRLSPNAEQK
jgi:hypothetical protein